MGLRLLALDTCLDACSAALLADGVGVEALSEPMTRGHQERLAPMVDSLMQRAGWRFDSLDRIAVTIGPGSFTGLRVGLAFAKGLALALGKPCVGIGVLEALAVSSGSTGFTAACLDGRRGQVYLQAFIDGHAAMAPDNLPVEIACARLAELWIGGPIRLVGSGAALIAGVVPGAQVLNVVAPDILAVGRLGAAAREPIPPPRPLYLRAPDAKLPGGLA